MGQSGDSPVSGQLILVSGQLILVSGQLPIFTPLNFPHAATFAYPQLRHYR
jgi:hypothetical protein